MQSLKIRNCAGIVTLFCVSLLLGCKVESRTKSPQELLDAALAAVDQTQLTTDLAIIDDSLAMWGFTDEVQIEPNGVRYIVHTMGTGSKPNLNSIIRLKYEAVYLTFGPPDEAVVHDTLDSNEDIEFYLSELIPGWQVMFPLLPKGTEATLYIPSGYAYGPEHKRDSQGKIIIPRNSNLIFNIELKDVR